MCILPQTNHFSPGGGHRSITPLLTMFHRTSRWQLSHQSHQRMMWQLRKSARDDYLFAYALLCCVTTIARNILFTTVFIIDTCVSTARLWHRYANAVPLTFIVFLLSRVEMPILTRITAFPPMPWSLLLPSSCVGRCLLRTPPNASARCLYEICLNTTGQGSSLACGSPNV